MAFVKKRTDKIINKRGTLWENLRAAFAKIHLVDKCLLMLMFVLLAQSGYVLLTNGANSEQANPVDIIVRTAAASIFGYFLSANFVQRQTAAKGHDIKAQKPEVLEGDGENQIGESLHMPQNKIGFALEKRETELEQGSAIGEEIPQDNGKISGVTRLQILTTAAIALFCLIALILVRDITGTAAPVSAAATAVASQFRDFISGCVGFLIGCPTSKSEGQ